MAILDIVFITIFSAFLARGLWIGLVRQVASIVAIFLAFLVAGQFYGQSAVFATPFVENEQLGFLLAYGVIFGVVYIVTIFVGLALKKVMNIVLLTWFDKAMGGVLGALKGLFLSTLIFMGLAIFISGSSDLFQDSKLYPLMEKTCEVILVGVRDHEIRDNLLPKKPAISGIISDTVKFGKKLGREAKEKAQDY